MCARVRTARGRRRSLGPALQSFYGRQHGALPMEQQQRNFVMFGVGGRCAAGYQGAAAWAGDVTRKEPAGRFEK